MQSATITSANYFRGLAILQWAMAAGITIFGIIATAITYGTGQQNSDLSLSGFLNYTVPVVGLAGLVVSYLVFKSKLNTARSAGTLGDKMYQYRAAFITRCAILEAAALFSIISSILTHYLGFISVGGALLVIILLVRPTARTAINDLALDESDSAVLENPEGVFEMNSP